LDEIELIDFIKNRG
jgi:hypothetical protein